MLSCVRRLSLGVAVLATAPALAQSPPPPPEPIPGQLIGQYAGGATPRAERRAMAAAVAVERRGIGGHAAVLRVDPGREARALAALRADPAVRDAAHDARVRAQRLPTDTYLPLENGLRNTGQAISTLGAGTDDADIDADLAWDVRTSGAPVVVRIGVRVRDRAGTVATGRA